MNSSQRCHCNAWQKRVPGQHQVLLSAAVQQVAQSGISLTHRQLRWLEQRAYEAKRLLDDQQAVSPNSLRLEMAALEASAGIYEMAVQQLETRQ